MAFGRNLLVAAAFAVTAASAQASQTCLPRDVIVTKLDERYDEQPVGRGLQGDARLFEVFMTQDGSSWTIVQSFPTGMSCIMAAGTHWQQADMATLFGTSS